MDFNEFIASLNEKDMRNYLQYSPIRGIQIFKIIFNALSKKNENVSYSDVNAFVKYDKALKDILYTYIGTLEDIIRKHIFEHFNLKNDIKYKKRYENCCELKDIIIKMDNKNDDVTELYVRWSLMMKETIIFLDKYDKDAFDLDTLENTRILRNKVMHHSTLIFDCYANSTKSDTQNLIQSLINILPDNYVGLAKKINKITENTRKNIKKVYECFLLDLFME